MIKNLGLKDKIVLLVGGSGGLGRQLMLFFESMGCVVVIVDLLDPEEFESFAPEDLDRLPYIKCDITKLSDVEACFEKIQEQFSTPDAVLNLAA